MIQHSKANIPGMHSQPGRRINPKVVQSRRPKNLLKQTQCHNA